MKKKNIIYYEEYLSDNNIDSKDDPIVQAIFKYMSQYGKLYLKASAGGGKTTAIQKLGDFLYRYKDIRTIICYPNTSILKDKAKNEFGFATVNGLSKQTKIKIETYPLVQTTPDALINANIQDPCLIVLDESTTMIEYSGFKDDVVIPLIKATDENFKRGGYVLSLDATDMINEAYGFNTLEALRVKNGKIIEPVQDVYIVETKKRAKTILNDIVHKIKNQSKETFTQVHINNKKLIKQIPDSLGPLSNRFAYIFSGSSNNFLEEIEMNRHYLPSFEDYCGSRESYNLECQDYISSLMGGALPEDCLGVFHTKKFEVGVNLNTTKPVELHIIGDGNMPTVTSVKQTANRRRKDINEEVTPVKTYVYGYYGNRVNNYTDVVKTIGRNYVEEMSEEDLELVLDRGYKYIQRSQEWNINDYNAKLKEFYMNPIMVPYKINGKVKNRVDQPSIIKH